MSKPDVPIAQWVGNPKSFTSGRKTAQPTVIVIHVTDGSEGFDDAENGAAYDKRRTDGTSTHYFVDGNSIVQEVEHQDEAHAAREHGNDIGIHIEICGLAKQTSAEWDDPISRATLENVARLIVAIRRTGTFPLVRLTDVQLRAAWTRGTPRGICGHVDITSAFPEDHGTHTDPGPNFPWKWLFTRVNQLEGIYYPPRKVNMITVEKIKVPELRQGDDDAKLPGYNHITRFQRILKIKDDGMWGKVTTAALANWCKVPLSEAAVMTETLYRRIYGWS